MELEKNYIYQVYLHGSFSKAAEALYITQPALSIAIKKVEQEIGADLFNRNSRPLTLTKIGQLYIEHIKQELQLEQELKQRFDDLRDLQTGDLLIGGTHYMNAYVLPPYLAEFHQLYPNINIEVSETSSDQLIELLKEHKIDLTFSCDEEVLKKFDHVPAFEDDILFAVPRSCELPLELIEQSLSAQDIASGRHLAEDCPTVDFSHFPDINFILIDSHVNLGMRTLKIFEEANLHPTIKIKVPQLVTSFLLAKAGVGATFTSDLLVEGTEESLRFFKLTSQYAHRQYYLLLPQCSYVPKTVKEFIKLLCE
ncbi:MAG: LysR family transcriptional regulator [Phascolarctobacterium sp.]|nr:LysR family transcriptional regulator [Phascolarctobacterium sp.]